MLGSVSTCNALSYSGGGEWNHSADITVMENSGQNLVDYQIPVLLTDSNFDFSKAQDSGEDVRFESGGKQLKHWIENWDKEDGEALVWVKVPFIAASGTTKIKLYYDNPLASDDSSGPATFLFFDDFSGSSVGFGDWESFYTGGGEIKVGSGNVRLIVPKFHPEDVSSIKSKDEFPVNTMFVVKRKKVTTGEDTRGPVIEQGFVDPQKESKNMILVHTELEKETKVTWVLENSKSDARYFPKDLTSINEPEDTWYSIGVAWYMEDELGRIAMFKDGVRDEKMDLAATEEMNYIPVSDMKVYLFASTYSDSSHNMGYAAFDHAYVRRFVSEEPTVVFGELADTAVTEEEPVAVRINVTPSGDKLSSIRIFNADMYSESEITELKNSGINTIVLRADKDNIWSLERLVKSAHEHDMQVYAMVLHDPENTDGSQIKNNVNDILDYNSKSLAGFDGILLSPDPCSDDSLEACQDNLLLLPDIKTMTGELPVAVDIPVEYDRSALSEISEYADIFVLLTYDAEGERLQATDNIVDSIAPKMGEIRAVDGKTLVEVAVNDDFITSADVQTLLEDIQNYYEEDAAYIGTSIVVYDEYLDYSGMTEEPEKDRSIPAFTGILATVGLLGAVLIFKKR